jgi:hypothetical protein
VSETLCHVSALHIRLSGWTLKGSIQQFIDVYVSRTTFAEVERAFPYMVTPELASGGGDVSASLVFRVSLMDHILGSRV